MKQRVILLHTQAPAKPPTGQVCNGCGVCCTAEPCPIGMLLSRRTRGACVALIWQPQMQRYGCGVVTQTWPGLPRWLANALRALGKRWISAGTGCDCKLQTTQG